VIDAESGLLLNTCTSDALAQLLRHLKRAYWPFQWSTALDEPAHGVYGSGGGFAAAAENALGMAQMDAYTQALSRTAKHRLDRGIWTSTGNIYISPPHPAFGSLSVPWAVVHLAAAHSAPYQPCVCVECLTPY
jgi:hypothetical protein